MLACIGCFDYSLSEAGLLVNQSAVDPWPPCIIFFLLFWSMMTFCFGLAEELPDTVGHACEFKASL